MFEVSNYDAFEELFSLRMREGETVASFANRFKGLLQQNPDVNWNIVQYIFLKKLPIEARTRPVRDLFEEEKSFKDLP